MSSLLYPPCETIITFDLHGVVFTLDYKAIIKLMWHHKKELIIMGFYGLNPFLWYQLFRLWRHHVPTARYLQWLESQYQGLRPCIPFMAAVANAQKPCLATIALIHKLKKEGFEVHLLSNIGHHLFEGLCARFPAIFQLFDAVQVTHAHNNYEGKPYQAFFDTYLARYNPHHKKIIFIDDTRRNIRACARYGMHGIYFQSPDQLKKILQELFALPDSKTHAH